MEEHGHEAIGGNSKKCEYRHKLGDGYTARQGEGDRNQEASDMENFFFSSRRRHTRYWRDWSSDVCSSDLCWLPLKMAPKKVRNSSGSMKLKKAALGLRQNSRRSRRYCRQARARVPVTPEPVPEIGRASCRERWRSGGAT